MRSSALRNRGREEQVPKQSGSSSESRSPYWLRLARVAIQRKPALFLGVITICLALTVLYSWQQIRNGELSGIVLVGANLCLFVIALVYVADDLQQR